MLGTRHGEHGFASRGTENGVGSFVRCSFAIILALLTTVPDSAISEDRPAPARVVSHANSTVQFEADGYALSCQVPRIFQSNGSSRIKVESTLPTKGMYYLDDKYVSYGWCDLIVCAPARNPYSVSLVQHEKTGERASPDGTVPVFRSIPLRGRLVISFETYSDKNCRRKRETEVTVEN
jgi:hypothetical protein